MIIKLLFLFFQWCWVLFASWVQQRPFSVIHPCCLKKPSRLLHTQMHSMLSEEVRWPKSHLNLLTAITKVTYHFFTLKPFSKVTRSSTDPLLPWKINGMMNAGKFWLTFTRHVRWSYICSVVRWFLGMMHTGSLTSHISNNCAKMGFIFILYLNDSSYYYLHPL